MYEHIIAQHIVNEDIGLAEVVDAFPRFTERYTIAKFLARYELFKKVLEVRGSIVECGVYRGSGVFAWAQFSALFEPYARFRRIYGFDTFEGFPAPLPEEERLARELNPEMKKGGFLGSRLEQLERSTELFDRHRHGNDTPKIHWVPGDACETIPKFVADTPHLVVALLYLDFDLYEPTLAALRHFVPRMPKGGIIVFDEVNNPDWPGETMALNETFGINHFEIRKFPFEQDIAYAVIK